MSQHLYEIMIWGYMEILEFKKIKDNLFFTKIKYNPLSIYNFNKNSFLFLLEISLIDEKFKPLIYIFKKFIKEEIPHKKFHFYKFFIKKIISILNKSPENDSMCEVKFHDGIVFRIISDYSEDLDFISINQKIIKSIRDKNRYPTFDELACIFLCEYLLNQGISFNKIKKPWLKSAIRKHQTILSITDPGFGHLYGTLLKAKYLDGIIIHIEHLNRGLNISREIIEPYRIPQPNLVDRIVYKAAGDAPVSTYVGRPLFEDNSQESFVKAIHTTAVACSNYFKAGVTECKICIENTT